MPPSAQVAVSNVESRRAPVARNLPGASFFEILRGHRQAEAAVAAR
jgi:hypothetical protein